MKPSSSLALAYRRYARQHPHRYRLMTDRFPPDADLDAARQHGLDAFRADLR